METHPIWDRTYDMGKFFLASAQTLRLAYVLENKIYSKEEEKKRHFFY